VCQNSKKTISICYGYSRKTRSIFSGHGVVYLIFRSYLVRRQQTQLGWRVSDDVTVRVAMRHIRVHSSIQTETQKAVTSQRADHQRPVVLVLFTRQSYHTAHQHCLHMHCTVTGPDLKPINNHNHNHNHKCCSALSTAVRPIVHYSVEMISEISL